MPLRVSFDCAEADKGISRNVFMNYERYTEGQAGKA